MATFIRPMFLTFTFFCFSHLPDTSLSPLLSSSFPLTNWLTFVGFFLYPVPPFYRVVRLTQWIVVRGYLHLKFRFWTSKFLLNINIPVYSLTCQSNNLGFLCFINPRLQNRLMTSLRNNMLVPIWLLLVFFPCCRAVDLTYSIEEGKSPSTYIGNVALDSHLLDGVLPQDQKLLRFSQMEHGLTGNALLFRVGKNSGKLYTAQILDAEVLCVRNKECFRMVDIAVRRRESFVKILEVKVIIKDINDNRPEFPEDKVQIEFSEESLKGARRSIPNAIDRDISPINSQITYQLKKGDDEPFTLSVLKSVDGISKLSIVLEERLNREMKDSYLIQVIAQDGATPPKESVLHVLIIVADVNDNTPVFSRNVYNVSIKYEQDITTPVAVLTAKDSDAGKNGEISYHFSSQTSSIAQSLFELNEKTGELFLSNKLSNGHEFKYELYVVAMDGGEPPLSSTAKVLVNIINQQNSPPTIDVNFVSASASKGNTATISEDIAVGSFIAYVKVTDNDVGQNGDVICELHHDKFLLQSIGVKKYKVTVKNPLDRETLDHYEITISCQDRGIPVLHSSNTFSIQVMDVNDIKPQFSRDTFKFSVNENQESKFPVGVINATDPDLGVGGKLTYTLLTNGKQFLPFQISANGSIFTVMSLDHEFQNIYEFQVLVKDNGQPPLNNTVDVIIEVRDENDNAPYFTFPSVNPYTLDVVYYPYRTSNITVLKATDSDSRENAFLKYEITAGNDKQLFTVNHYSGLLSFTHVVTRQDAGVYDLQFAVKDSGNPVLCATTNLSLVLTVSNKSFEMLNAVHKQIEDQIHLYLLIAIVLVAVIISVPPNGGCVYVHHPVQRQGLLNTSR